ncbi:GTP-binding protein HSR1 [candidate division KSB3 bacterium]|uniref:GTP-binding protein HSR1 n=1 Tax=candidate division KSB3 bacterium TaxID=2044937 RepID=A0A2G6KK26_9BACT|nr:MAG: GTP-binding protein HSR1 [candidate division KSB3 bacterium]
MPTNLPPECADAEQRYREAKTPGEKISSLEEYIGLIPKHKGTDRLRADLRKRLSKLRNASQSKKGAGKHDSVFHIDKEGAGQVVLAGLPNVGKSALVAKLTHANPEVANFPFTTWKPLPGMMPIKDIQLQLIDTPPLNREYMEPDLLDMIRRAELLGLVVNIQTDPLQQLEEAVAILYEHKIAFSHLRTHEADVRKLTILPGFLIVNAFDNKTFDEDLTIFCTLLDETWPLLPVSAVTGVNLERLKQEFVDRLHIIRVYSKAPGKKPDLHEPYTLKKGSSVKDFAEKVHRDFSVHLKSARMWGTGVYDGQMVHHDHILYDGDVVELHL